MVVEDLGFAGRRRVTSCAFWKTAATPASWRTRWQNSQHSRPRGELCRVKVIKHAVTEQCFAPACLATPAPDLSKFEFEGCKVLEYARHNAIASGSVERQRLPLVLREVTDRDDVENASPLPKRRRAKLFLRTALWHWWRQQPAGRWRWGASSAPVRDRNKRSLLSAARSALFNQIVSERLKKLTRIKLLLAMRLAQLVDAEAGLYVPPMRWPMPSRAWTLNR